MQRYFYADDGTGLYRVGYGSGHGARYATAWEFGRALVGTLALAGVQPQLLGKGGRSPYLSAVEDRLAALSHYWDPASNPPGFDGRPVEPVGPGGDKYYDDNAWLGLALLQHYQMTGSPSSLGRAAAVHAFAYPGGWQTIPADAYPGGIYWVQQGAGAGLANHDRTCTSNAPNAEIAFLLHRLRSNEQASFLAAGMAIQDWVLRNLHDDGSGLLFDKVTGDGTIDTTLRTYNQGAAIAANVARYRSTGQVPTLSQAETIAKAALNYFSDDFYVNHPCVFNAIYFRGLLQLLSVSSDGELKAKIVLAMQTYAEEAWSNHRSPDNLFGFPGSATSDQLLDQAAIVQILASLAWDPADYLMLG